MRELRVASHGYKKVFDLGDLVLLCILIHRYFLLSDKRNYIDLVCLFFIRYYNRWTAETCSSIAKTKTYKIYIVAPNGQ